MNDELVIDESNFSQYFKDVRLAKPERGEIMAQYCAMAELVEGRLKSDLIDLILNKDGKIIAATQVMRKLGCASEIDSIRVCKEIASDLNSGLDVKEVERKAYKYKLEMFYYTKKEYVPVGDPHWSVISITNLDEFLDAANQKLELSSRIIEEGTNAEEME